MKGNAKMKTKGKLEKIKITRANGRVEEFNMTSIFGRLHLKLVNLRQRIVNYFSEVNCNG